MTDPAPATRPLVALPAQPTGLGWPGPGTDWPVGEPPDGVDLAPLLEVAFDEQGPMAATFATVIVWNGRIVAERYGGRLEHFDRPATPVEPATKLLSWSLAKSMLHAVVGMLVAEGRLTAGTAADDPRWDRPDDERRAITVEHLLQMRDGLDFTEDYVDEGASDVIEMLFGRGRADVAAFAADRPLVAPPGERFSYSSGTSNILSGMVARLLGPGRPYEEFLHRSLFSPLGMTSAEPGFDEAGTWIASSSVHATARDFARFGYLYLRDGWWNGRRLLPPGWVDGARRARSVDPTDGRLHGAHWWVVDDAYGTFRASGYDGQAIIVVPALDLLIVRLGHTPAERQHHLVQWWTEVIVAFAGARAVAGAGD